MFGTRRTQPVRKRSLNSPSSSSSTSLLLSPLLLLTSLVAVSALSSSELAALNELMRRGWIPSSSCDTSMSLSSKVVCSTSASSSWVTQLNLAAPSPLLNGTIPTEIGLLTNLTQLDISGNRLVGSVPSEIAKLTGLTRLSLKANLLGGWLDDVLSSLKSVTSCAFGSQSGNIFSCSATLQRSAFATRCGLTCGPETVLMEDSLPPGLSTSAIFADTDQWLWVTSPVYSGCCSHLSKSLSTTHQHFFGYTTSFGLAVVPATAVFSVYIYLNANDMPTQLMLQFASPFDWHRASWSASSAVAPLPYGIATYMGPIPQPGMWHRLEVKAGDIGIVGKALGGLAFSLYGGSASWDRSGYTDLKACTRARPTNGGVGTCASTASETRCSIVCDDGYTPTPAFSQCTAGNLVFPQVCKENGCSGAAPANGVVGTCADVAGGANCSVTCKTGYAAFPAVASCIRGSLVPQVCVALSSSELFALTALVRRGWIPSASCDYSMSPSRKVVCSISGSRSWVTQLNLAATSPLLNGTIPTEIGLLTNLTQLNITRNRLVGSVPSEIAKLTGLTRLTLNANQLSGWLDNGLSSLKSVTSCVFGPQREGFSFSCSATLQRSAFATRCGLTCGPGTVLMEDSLPPGLPTSTIQTQEDQWLWVTSPVYSGCCSHLSKSLSTTHQHFFGPTTTFGVAVVPASAVFSAYIYLNANDMPTQLMLQFASPNEWHRASWSASSAVAPLTYGITTYMGPIPQPGMWHRLEVNASDIGIVGKALSGLAFSLYGGSATWDRSGYTDLKQCTRTAPTNGNVGTCGSTDSETKCSIVCDDGYTPTPAFSQCTAGNLVPPQVCQAKVCRGTAPENGYVGTCAAVPSGGTCSVTCDSGYTPFPVVASCVGGQLDSQTCIERRCTAPVPLNGRIGTCSDVFSGEFCSVVCDTGYTASPAISSCLRGMLDYQTCIANNCSRAAPERGRVGTCASVKSGSLCSVDCNSGFTATPDLVMCLAGFLPAQTCNARADEEYSSSAADGTAISMAAIIGFSVGSVCFCFIVAAVVVLAILLVLRSNRRDHARSTDQGPSPTKLDHVFTPPASGGGNAGGA